MSTDIAVVAFGGVSREVLAEGRARVAAGGRP